MASVASPHRNRPPQSTERGLNASMARPDRNMANAVQT